MGFHRGCRVALAAAVAWVVAGLAAPAFAVTSPFAPTPGQGTFLVLSDIHFDPFGDDALVRRLAAAPVEEWRSLFAASGRTPVSGLGSDANFTLMTSALDAAATLPVDYVLVGGDLLSHGFEPAAAAILGGDAAARVFAIKTSVFVAREIQSRFPTVPVVPTLGNNDSDCGDYAVEPDGDYLARLADTWRVFADAPAAARGYARTGSYAIAHPTVPKHRLVVVNDVFLSRKYDDVCRPADKDPGRATMDWLETRLDEIAGAGETATLLFHIPPGYDGFASASAGPSCSAAVPLWQPHFNARFAALARRHRDTIRGAIAGHLHSDGFRVFGADTAAPFLPMHVVPSVSPIFDNNPAFTLFLYRRADGRPLDDAVFFLQVADGRPVGEWRIEYTARAEYGLAGIGAGGLRDLSRRIAAGAPEAAAFRRNFSVRAHPAIDAATWRAYLCAQVNFTEADFAGCRCAP